MSSPTDAAPTEHATEAVASSIAALDAARRDAVAGRVRSALALTAGGLGLVVAGLLLPWDTATGPLGPAHGAAPLWWAWLAGAVTAAATAVIGARRTSWQALAAGCAMGAVLGLAALRAAVTGNDGGGPWLTAIGGGAIALGQLLAASELRTDETPPDESAVIDTLHRLRATADDT